MSVADPVSAVRDLVEQVAADGTLSPAQRARVLEEMRADLATLVGRVDRALGDDDLRRQGEAIAQARRDSDVRLMVMAREEGIRQGAVSADAMDAAGIPTLQEYRVLAHDGRLDELAWLSEAGKRGGDRKVPIMRLPNGHFAPKGQGSVLTAGMEVSVPHKSGKGTVSGEVTSVRGTAARVKLHDGPDAGKEFAIRAHGPKSDSPVDKPSDAPGHGSPKPDGGAGAPAISGDEGDEEFGSVDEAKKAFGATSAETHKDESTDSWSFITFHDKDGKEVGEGTVDDTSGKVTATGGKGAPPAAGTAKAGSPKVGGGSFSQGEIDASQRIADGMKAKKEGELGAAEKNLGKARAALDGGDDAEAIERLWDAVEVEGISTPNGKRWHEAITALKGGDKAKALELLGDDGSAAPSSTPDASGGAAVVTPGPLNRGKTVEFADGQRGKSRGPVKYGPARGKIAVELADETRYVDPLPEGAAAPEPAAPEPTRGRPKSLGGPGLVPDEDLAGLPAVTQKDGVFHGADGPLKPGDKVTTTEHRSTEQGRLIKGAQHTVVQNEGGTLAIDSGGTIHPLSSPAVTAHLKHVPDGGGDKPAGGAPADSGGAKVVTKGPLNRGKTVEFEDGQRGKSRGPVKYGPAKGKIAVDLADETRYVDPLPDDGGDTGGDTGGGANPETPGGEGVPSADGTDTGADITTPGNLPGKDGLSPAERSAVEANLPEGSPSLDEIHDAGLNEWPTKGEVATKILGDAADTQQLHAAKGKKSSSGGPVYSAARKALHDKIVADALGGHKPPADGQPRVLFMAGGAASGKGTALESAAEGVVPHDAVHIDPDEVKQLLPEYQAMVKGGERYAAAAAHEESSDIAKRIQAEAMAAGLNVVIDGTGNSKRGKFEGKLKAMHEAGYKVRAFYVTIPTEVAIPRAIKRAERSGRFVPIPEMKTQHKNVSAWFPDIAGLDFLDGLDVYDNGGEKGDPAKQVVTYVDGKLKVLDQDAYDSFIAKGKE